MVCVDSVLVSLLMVCVHGASMVWLPLQAPQGHRSLQVVLVMPALSSFFWRRFSLNFVFADSSQSRTTRMGFVSRCERDLYARVCMLLRNSLVVVRFMC